MADDTKQAAKEEEERLKRIAERQALVIPRSPLVNCRVSLKQHLNDFTDKSINIFQDFVAVLVAKMTWNVVVRYINRYISVIFEISALLQAVIYTI